MNMSADNFWLIRRDGSRYVVSMEFASSDELEDPEDKDPRFDTLGEAVDWCTKQDQEDPYGGTEYGIQFGPGVSFENDASEFTQYVLVLTLPAECLPDSGINRVCDLLNGLISGKESPATSDDHAIVCVNAVVRPLSEVMNA